jgi:hypothetical protein
MARTPKSETIEIRVPAETKSALQAKASGDDKTVSEVLRAFIASSTRHGFPCFF